MIETHGVNSDVAQTFWSMVDRTNPDGCWTWTGPRHASKDGRGQQIYFRSSGWCAGHGLATRSPRRIALLLDGRSVSADKAIAETCEDPTCVNPAHLTPLSRRDPAILKVRRREERRKGRLRSGRSETARQFEAEGWERTAGNLTDAEVNHVVSRLRLDEETKCWNWTGAVAARHRVALVGLPKARSRRAARLLFIAFMGPEFIEGIHLVRRCTSELCVSPLHWVPGVEHPARGTPAAERLAAKFTLTPAGCWQWTARTTENGYGWFRYQGRQTYAHRASYAIHVGPIPDGLVLDHVCANKLCVNPEHLEPVTTQENVLRGFVAAQGRHVMTEKVELGPKLVVPQRVLDHFWAKVEKGASDECWAWRGRTVRGYGVFAAWMTEQRASQTWRAHRFSFAVMIGSIPEGLVLGHLCNTKHCVNPAHLELVTTQENSRRAFARSVQLQRTATSVEEETVTSICEDLHRRGHR